ncbi:MAG: DinB family protein [Chloroflexi bacterium]|nr:DinB family protein [Chloroflexota bacterium]
MKAGLGIPSLEEQPPSRQAVRAEMEATRIAFHGLLASMTLEDWRRRSVILEWTNGQLAAHILSYVSAVIPRGVRFAQKGKRTAGFPPWLVKTGLADRINVLSARWIARNLTPASTRAAYDEAHGALLALLEETPEDEWWKSTYIFGKQMTIRELFMSHARHLEEHLPHVRHDPHLLPTL